MANHDTMPLIKSATVMPPTTPPAIAPLFELLLVGEFDGDDDTDKVVEVGVTETVPVTSGASPTSCAAVKFQLSSGVGSRNAHRGTRVPTGMGLGKIPAATGEVQFVDHTEYKIHGSPWHASQALNRLYATVLHLHGWLLS